MYQAILSVHYTSLAAVVAIWFVTALPLTVVGTMLGRNWNGDTSELLTNTQPTRRNTQSAMSYFWNPRIFAEKKVVPRVESDDSSWWHLAIWFALLLALHQHGELILFPVYRQHFH